MSESRKIIEVDPTKLTDPLHRKLIKRAMEMGAALKKEQMEDTKLDSQLKNLIEQQRDLVNQFSRSSLNTKSDAYRFLQKESKFLITLTRDLSNAAARAYFLTDATNKVRILEWMNELKQFISKTIKAAHSQDKSQTLHEYNNMLTKFKVGVEAIKTLHLLPNYVQMEEDPAKEYPVTVDGQQYVLKLKNHDMFYRSSHGVNNYSYEVSAEHMDEKKAEGSGGFGSIYTLAGKIAFTLDDDIEFRESAGNTDEHADNIYVVKRTKDALPSEENQIASEIEHLHSKADYFAGVNLIAMRAMPGKDMQKANLISHSMEQQVPLILKMLYTYESQVAAYGRRHLDIKFENIMMAFDSSNKAKHVNYIDYQFSRKNDEPDSQSGTLTTAAPESRITERDTSGAEFVKTTQKADVYAFGIVIAEMFDVNVTKIFNEANAEILLQKQRGQIKNNVQAEATELHAWYSGTILIELSKKLGIEEIVTSQENVQLTFDAQIACFIFATVVGMLKLNITERYDIKKCIQSFEKIHLDLLFLSKNIEKKKTILYTNAADKNEMETILTDAKNLSKGLQTIRSELEITSNTPEKYVARLNDDIRKATAIEKALLI